MGTRRSTERRPVHPAEPASRTVGATVGDAATARRELIPGTEWVVHRLGRPLAFLWGRGFRFLFVLDAVVLGALLIAISLVRHGWEWPTYPRSHYWVGFSIAVAIHLVVGYFAGLYEREPRLGRRPWLPRVVVATGAAVAVDGLAAVLLERYLMPRFSLAVFAVTAAIALAANRRLSRALARRRDGPPRVVLVGTPDDVEMARSHLATSDRDAAVVATLPGPARLLATVEATRANEVLLLDTSSFDAVFPEPLTSLERRGVGALQRVSAKETLLGLQAVREVAGMPFVKLRTHALAAHELRLKRILELGLVAATTPVWVPVLVLTAAYVRLAAGPPVRYRQPRVGRDGVVFDMVKFRTMVRDAETMSGPMLATARDARVVRGLGWLRGTRLDELPQLWHVLTGEMALVGPRPERPEMTESFSRLIPGYERRHELAPGITGLAQVQGRYDTDPGYKLGHDLQYLVNWSPVLDLQILVRTVVVVATRRV